MHHGRRDGPLSQDNTCPLDATELTQLPNALARDTKLPGCLFKVQTAIRPDVEAHHRGRDGPPSQNKTCPLDMAERAQLPQALSPHTKLPSCLFKAHTAIGPRTVEAHHGGRDGPLVVLLPRALDQPMLTKPKYSANGQAKFNRSFRDCDVLSRRRQRKVLDAGGPSPAGVIETGELAPSHPLPALGGVRSWRRSRWRGDLLQVVLLRLKGVGAVRLH